MRYWEAVALEYEIAELAKRHAALVAACREMLFVSWAAIKHLDPDLDECRQLHAATAKVQRAIEGGR